MGIISFINSLFGRKDTNTDSTEKGIEKSQEFNPIQNIVVDTTAESNISIHDTYEIQSYFSANRDIITAQRRAELKEQAYQMHLEFQDIAQAATDEICLEELEDIIPDSMYDLDVEEILFMAYISGKPTNLEIPGYFTHEYHVDFQNTLIRIFSSGYIKFGDYKTAIQNMKSSDLKELLSEFSQPITGTLKILRERVLSTIPIDVLSSRYDGTYFILTPKGQSIVDDNEHILFFHKNKNRLDISIYQANAYKEKHPNATNKQIAYALLGNGNKYLKNREYGLYRNLIYKKSYIAQKEKLPKEELFFLFQCCFLDFIGCYNCGIDKKFSFFAPGLMTRIKTILKKEERAFIDTYDEFKEAVQKVKIIYNPNDIDCAFYAIMEQLQPKD